MVRLKETGLHFETNLWWMLWSLKHFCFISSYSSSHFGMRTIYNNLVVTHYDNLSGMRTYHLPELQWLAIHHPYGCIWSTGCLYFLGGNSGLWNAVKINSTGMIWHAKTSCFQRLQGPKTAYMLNRIAILRFSFSPWKSTCKHPVFFSKNTWVSTSPL